MGLKQTLKGMFSRSAKKEREAELLRLAFDQGFKLQRSIPSWDQSRLHSNFSTTYKSIISLTQTNWLKVVSRMMQEYRTNPICLKAIETAISMTLGTGYQPVPAPIDRSGGKVPELKKILKEDWKRFNDQIYQPLVVDASFYDSQRQALRTLHQTGSFLVHTQISKDKNRHLPIVMDLVSPVQLDWSQDNMAFDQYDNRDQNLKNPTIFGMTFGHNSNKVVSYRITGYEEKIPSSSIKIFFPAKELMQPLGWPPGTQALITMFNIGELYDAKLQGAKTVSSIPLWVQKDDRGEFKSSKDRRTSDLNDTSNISWEMGRILSTKTRPEPIEIGEKITETFQPLVNLFLQIIAGGFGESPVALTGDLTSYSYASSRMSETFDKRAFGPWTKWMTSGPGSYSKYIWDTFVKWEFWMGKIPGKSFTDYQGDPWGLSEAYFLPKDAPVPVDENKKADANKTKLASGQMLFSTIAAEHSMGVEEYIEQIKEEYAALGYAGNIMELFKSSIFGVKEQQSQEQQNQTTENQNAEGN